jgi:hypothetical protein
MHLLLCLMCFVAIHALEPPPSFTPGPIKLKPVPKLPAPVDFVHWAGNSLGIPPYTPGRYTMPGSVTLAASELVTLDNGGVDDAVFEFSMPGTLSTGAQAKINVIGTGKNTKVVWKVGDAVTLGASTRFLGDIMSKAGLNTGAGTVVDGNLMCKGAVTLRADTHVNGGISSIEGAITFGASSSATGVLKTIPGVSAITLGAGSSILAANSGGAITIGAGSLIARVYEAKTVPRALIAAQAVTVSSGTIINGGRNEIVAGAAVTIETGVKDINGDLIV